MSPEQCRGEAIDYRTDVYAFGVMAHQMLTGHLPFEGDSLLKIMTMHASATPPRMSQENPSLPAPLDTPVLRMLEKNPARRPQSVGEAYRELSDAARALGHEIPSTPSSPRRPMSSSEAPRATLDGTRGRAVKAAGTLGPQTLSDRPPRRLIALTTALTTGTLAVIATTLVVSHGRSVSPQVPASAVPRGEASESGAAAERAAPPEAKAFPRSAETVRFSVQSVPPGVEAFLQGRSLGTAPGPLIVPRGDKPLTLHFKAAGYHPKSVAITPTSDGVVSVTLSPLSGAPAPQVRSKRPVDDLEF